MRGGGTVEILDVALVPIDRNVLWGRHIDQPKAGAAIEGASFPIVGWALGRSEPVVAVELVSDGRVIATTALGEPRPDLAAAFPDVVDADRGGYQASATVVGAVELWLELRARLQSERCVPLATLRARRRVDALDAAVGTALVSVVITARDQAEILGGAIESVLAQTYPRFEVVVVDDGSTDDTLAVARRSCGVRIVELAGAGVACARNAGLEASRGGFLVFMDARDRLLPDAIETGLIELVSSPQLALTSGTAVVCEPDPQAAEYPQQPLITHDHYTALLRGNYVLSHASVMYRHAALGELGAFDPELVALSEYDLYLRLARRFPVGCHPQPVVEDRTYGGRATQAETMLKAGEEILRRQRRHVRDDPRRRAALTLGSARWRADWRGQRTSSRAHAPSPRVGRLDFGHLGRVTPISTNFGYDRGRPVDRHYIEGFLERNAADVHGRVLEVQENDYTLRFGGDRVTRSDVLSLRPSNTRATLIGDLADPSALPEESFDCVILTQTLHLIFDLRAALETVYRSLREDGVLLLTTPGITQVEWGEAWNWSLTVLSVKRLLEPLFGPPNVSVESHGNVLGATAFLQGIAVEELTADELDLVDPAYPVIVTARAINRGSSPLEIGMSGEAR